MILRSILRSLTATTFLLFLAYPSIGTPTDDQRPVAYCKMIQLSPDIQELADPKAAGRVNYVATLTFKFDGSFYNGKVFGRAKVQASNEGAILENIGLDSVPQFVKRFAGVDISIGHTYNLKRPNQGDIVDIIDNDGLLTWLALNLPSNDLKGRAYEAVLKLITSYAVRKGVDLDRLLKKPHELGNIYYEYCKDEKPSSLRRIALGSSVKIIPLSVEETSRHFAHDPENKNLLLETEKLVRQMPLFSHPKHLIKLSIPNGQPFQVKTEGDIDGTLLRPGIPEFSGVKLQNNEISFFSQEDGFKVQRTSTVTTNFDRLDFGEYIACYLSCIFPDKGKTCMKFGPIYFQELRTRSGPERGWRDGERVEKDLLREAERYLFGKAPQIYSSIRKSCKQSK